MITKEQASPSNRLCFLGLLLGVSLLMNLTCVGLVQAGGCFMPVYYDVIFKPMTQEAKDGDQRLKGLSDYVAVKGEDPHGSGSGCMCGINNGKWDQVFLNDSPNLKALAPVSFKLLGVHIEYFEKNGQRKGKPVDIPAAKIAGCWNLGLSAGDYRPFNAVGGQSDSAQMLEPGENLLSCLCLGPKNRGGAGYAWIELSFQPMVYVQPLKNGPQALNLAPGAGRYFALSAGTAKPVITMNDAGGAKLYTRSQKQGWSDQLSEWKEHKNQTAELAGGDAYWILVRAGQAKASPKLTAAHTGSAPDAGFVKAGPAGKRYFKTYVLCGFKPSINNAQRAAKYDWQGCCNRPDK